MPILLHMKPVQSGKWEGEVYNAQNGKTYDSEISLAGPDKLRIEGCVLGFLCGGETWDRYKTAAVEPPKGNAGLRPPVEPRGNAGMKRQPPPQPSSRQHNTAAPGRMQGNTSGAPARQQEEGVDVCLSVNQPRGVSP
jgi:hypothetical protein